MRETERIVRFGKNQGLSGVFCEPAGGRDPNDKTAVLFWNVGINHHVGPYRLFVDLARRLADADFCSLRFDVSGLGDSEHTKNDSRPEDERAVDDVREAMDFLRRTRGFERFVLLGFCSSVDSAHALAVEDPSVVGVIYMEGHHFKTFGHYVRYPLRFLDLNRWARLALLRYERHFSPRRGGAAPELEQEAVFLPKYPTREGLGSDFERMIDRGARLFFLYVAGDSTYSYRRQLFDALRGRDLANRVELEFWRDADHVFFLPPQRARAVARLERFVRENFGRSVSPAARNTNHQPAKPSTKSPLTNPTLSVGERS